MAQDSSVIIIEPSSSGLRLLSKAKEMGRSVVVFTAGEGERRIDPAVLRQADRVESVDTNDNREVVARALRVARESEVSAVLPGFEYYVPIAAEVAERLGLPGNGPVAAHALRLKDAMRAALVRAGVRVPRFHVVTSEADLEAVVHEGRFPYVIKPTDGSGSLNVVKVCNAMELRAAFAATRAAELRDMGRLFGERLLIEEYVQGPEFSVEGYVYKGSIRFVSVTEKLLGFEPYFVEAGHVVSAALDVETEKRIRDYVTEVIRALDLTVGPFHAELRLSLAGPVLIEIGARLAGDHICELIQSSRGIDLFHAMIRCYEGADPEVREPLARRFSGIQFFIRPALRRFSRVSGWDKLARVDGYQSSELIIKPGECVPEATSFLGRIGYAIFTRDSYQGVRSSMSLADEVVQFHS